MNIGKRYKSRNIKNIIKRNRIHPSNSLENIRTKEPNIGVNPRGRINSDQHKYEITGIVIPPNSPHNSSKTQPLGSFSTLASPSLGSKKQPPVRKKSSRRTRRKRSILKKLSNVFTPLFIFLRVNNLPVDEKYFRTTFFISKILLSVILLVLSPLAVVLCSSHKGYTIAIYFGLTALTIWIALLVYITTGFYHVYAIIFFGLALVIVMVSKWLYFGLYTSEFGIFNNYSLIWGISFPVVVTSMKIHYIPKIVFLVLFFVNFVANFAVDVVFDFPKENYESNQNSKNRIFDYVLIYLGIFLSISVILILNLVQRFQVGVNLRYLEKITKHISQLKLETKFISNLLELEDSKCSKIMVLLKRIVLNTIEYKPYLPKELFMIESDEEKQMSKIASQRTNISSISSPKLSYRSSNSGSTLSSPAGSGRTHSSYSINSNASSGGMMGSNRSLTGSIKKRWKKSGDSLESLERRFGVGVEVKEQTLILIDIENFHDLLKQFISDEIIILHSKYLEECEKIIKDHRGVVHTFFGDKIFASWNSCKFCIDHEISACRAALEIQKNIKSKVNSFLDSKNLPKIKVKIAIVTGLINCGNMGSSTLKRYTHLGFSVNKIFSIVKLCSKFKCDILCDEMIYKKAKYYFHFRINDLLIWDNDARENTVIYTLVKEKKKKKKEEWNYQISEMFNSYKDDIDIVWELYSQCRLEEALIHLENVKKKEKLLPNPLKVLEKRLKQGILEGYQLKNKFPIESLNMVVDNSIEIPII